MKRKFLASLLVVAMGASLLTGCGSKGSADNAGSGAEGASTEAAFVLKYSQGDASNYAAADELKAKGYGIVSGDGDIWHAVENSSDAGWIVDGKLTIDPKREAFLDLSKKLKDGGLHNDTQDWQDAWFADMKGEGAKGIFGFFGPAWLINYTLAPNCGGSAVGEG